MDAKNKTVLVLNSAAVSQFPYTHGLFGDWQPCLKVEGAGLAFDIQKCSNFSKSIMVVLNL